MSHYCVVLCPLPPFPSAAFWGGSEVPQKFFGALSTIMRMFVLCHIWYR